MALVIALMAFFGLSRRGCDFILLVLRTLVIACVSATTASSGMSVALYAANELTTNLPKTMKTVFSRFESILSDHSTIFACCPSCSCIYSPNHDRGAPTYPTECKNQSSPNADPCGGALLQKGMPIRPFVLPDYFRYLSKLLSLKDIEAHIDNACDLGLGAARDGPPTFVESPFQATFIRTLKGPDGINLFIDGGPKKEARLVFSLNVDWFNVFRSTTRGSSTSTGVICLSCLNLPNHIRYKPEFMFVAIIPGPSIPTDDQMNHFLRPLIDSLRKTFYQGLKFSSTANFPNGRVVRSVIGPVVCDLPAARKLAGLISYNANENFCTHCCSNEYGHSDHPALRTEVPLCGISSLEIPKAAEYLRESYSDVDPSTHEAAAEDDPIDSIMKKLTPDPRPYGWMKRAVAHMRLQAFAWLTRASNSQRDKCWTAFGVRFSEIWHSPPFWNPVKQLVFDPMHTLLEGVVHVHFREFLRLSEEHKVNPTPTFRINLDTGSPEFVTLLRDLDPAMTTKKLASVKSQAKHILDYLMAAVETEDVFRKQLTRTFGNYLKLPLYAVAKELDLVKNVQFGMVTKATLIEKLLTWVSLFHLPLYSLLSRFVSV